jgi:hypothetical protein
MPLIKVEVKDVRFLNSGVHKPYAHGVPYVCPENRRHRVTEHPGAMVLLLVENNTVRRVAVIYSLPQNVLTIHHRLGAVRDGHNRRDVVMVVTGARVGLRRGVLELRLVMEEDYILAVRLLVEVRVLNGCTPIMSIESGLRYDLIVIACLDNAPRYDIHVKPIQLL